MSVRIQQDFIMSFSIEVEIINIKLAFTLFYYNHCHRGEMIAAMVRRFKPSIIDIEEYKI